MTAVDPDELRRTAERVLDEAEFREPQPSLVDRVVEAVGDLISELVEGLGGGGAGTVVGWAIVIAAVGGLVWLVARVVPDARMSGSTRRGSARRGPTVDVARDRSPRSWDDEAADHEAAGRWDEALRARYRALVARLAARGALRDAPASTTGEHRSVLQADDRRLVDVGAFDSSADRFDEVWYGGAAASPADVDRTRRLGEQMDGTDRAD